MAAQFKGFNSIHTNSRNDSARLDEVIDVIKWVDKKWVPIRVLPLAPLQVRQAWIKIYGGKERKEFAVPRYVVNFDPNNPEKPKKGVRCPYSELVTDKDGPVRVSDFWLFNVIDRDMQEEGPPRRASKPTKEEKSSGFKDINSETWTPVKVARFTMTSIMRMTELSEDNIVKNKKTKAKEQYDASDAKYGFDVKVKYKKDAPGTDKYSIDKVDGGATPLTDEEKKYLVWKLDEALLDATGRMTEKQALEDVKRMEIVGGAQPDDDDDDDDDDKKKKSKKKSRSLDDDDDDDDKKKKSKKKNKAKDLFKDDDDDDDDDEDDKKSKKSKKSSKKSSDKKSTKDKVKSKKSKKDDDDDDDDDEDDKPKKSSKKSSDKKASKDKVKSKSKKSKIDEDDKPKKKAKKDSWKDDEKSSKKSTKGGAKEKVKSKDKAKVKKKK